MRIDEGDQENLARIGNVYAGFGPAIRVAVGLGDPERERELLPALHESGEFIIAERCLAADQLLLCLENGRVDVALVAASLHRLSAGMLKELGRFQIPLVLLGGDSAEASGYPIPATVLPDRVGPETVQQALRAAVRGERPKTAPPVEEPEASPIEPSVGSQPLPTTNVVAVTGGHGSPGRTTVAVNLATALGAVAPTLLVDADLSAPSLAAYLDADPTRNLYMIAHGEPETPRDWERSIAREVQPIGDRSPFGAVLCGLPKPEMRGLISPRFSERLIAELEQRYTYLVLDVGPVAHGPGASLQRAALTFSPQILLVASADLVGLWQARKELLTLKTQIKAEPDRIALVINRYHHRHHHRLGEIGWALGMPVAAAIPHDYRGVQKAITARRPLVAGPRSRAGRAMLDLAGRLHQGRIVLPPVPSREKRARGRMKRKIRLSWPRFGWRKRSPKGASDGDYAISPR